ncbi:hypothetical protein K4L44_05385 [Halosquirtibacter laminarini]|uniref:Uncharacterized protein n=1 Tax=Halosquirtibacter laminarini TaxID=3374600 RepID=A0AC61NHX8_9BACT|nr:hypothetical protein K4L44_05385 [Prolixibacteraceae bacterium]
MNNVEEFRDCTRLCAIHVMSIVFNMLMQQAEAGASYLPGVAASKVGCNIYGCDE